MSNRNRGILYTAVILCAGATLGATLMRLHDHGWRVELARSLEVSVTQLAHIAEHPGTHIIAARSPETHVIEEVRMQVGLDDLQGRQLDAILEDSVRRHEELRTFFMHVNQESLDRIRSIMNEQQRKELDKMTKRK